MKVLYYVIKGFIIYGLHKLLCIIHTYSKIPTFFRYCVFPLLLSIILIKLNVCTCKIILVFPLFLVFNILLKLVSNIYAEKRGMKRDRNP